MLKTKVWIALGATVLGAGGLSYAATRGNPGGYVQAVKQEGCPIGAMAAMWGGKGGACPTGGAPAPASGVKLQVSNVSDGVEVRLTAKDPAAVKALQSRGAAAAQAAVAACGDCPVNGAAKAQPAQ